MTRFDPPPLEQSYFVAIPCSRVYKKKNVRTAAAEAYGSIPEI